MPRRLEQRHHHHRHCHRPHYHQAPCHVTFPSSSSSSTLEHRRQGILPTTAIQISTIPAIVVILQFFFHHCTLLSMVTTYPPSALYLTSIYLFSLIFSLSEKIVVLKPLSSPKPPCHHAMSVPSLSSLVLLSSSSLPTSSQMS